MGMRHKAGMGSNQNPASPDVESSEAWHLGHNTHTSTLDSGQLPSSRMRNPNRLRRIGVITSLRTSGFPGDLRGPITISRTSGFQLRSPDLSKNLRVPITPLGSSYDLMIQRRTSGFPLNSGNTSGFPDDLRDPGRPPGPCTTSGLRKQSLDSKSPYSRKLETSGFRAHLSGPSYNLWVPRLPSGPSVISRSWATPTQRLSSTNN
ncbi:hypothetical protein F2Q70_00011446 [Brassica cretica]|uniref:Uncharacterized protein n=1 Tax=Brassica cretica TaxID=69181 RepID=A0A8S9M466_BRACR|nr:hypothetical protein F2Q70_00011446 [Brassica cretica]